MPELLLQILHELNSSVFVLLAMFVFIVLFAFKSGGWIGAWKEKFSHHEGRIGKAERIADIVIEIKTKIDLMYQQLPSAFAKASSPLQFTEIGKDIINKIDANKVFSKYEKYLINQVEKFYPKNAYDIQEVCFNIVKQELKKLLTEEELGVMKNEAFKRGVPVEEIISLFGIILRDKMLENKGIPISDVDKHDNSKKK